MFSFYGVVVSMSAVIMLIIQQFNCNKSGIFISIVIILTYCLTSQNVQSFHPVSTPMGMGW